MLLDYIKTPPHEGGQEKLAGVLKVPLVPVRSWQQDLERGPYEPSLKRVLRAVDSAVEAAVARNRGTPVSAHTFAREFMDMLGPLAQRAALSGKFWARRFLPWEKTAAAFDWNIADDVAEIVRGLGEKPTPHIHEAVSEALASGTGPPVRQLERTYDAERAKQIARTTVMNIHAKATLREAAAAGYGLVRRVEINDLKTCAKCRALNYRTYRVELLLDVPNPLTRDSHGNCRGVFIPIINSLERLPDAELHHTEDLDIGGNKVERAPREYVPWLRTFLKRTMLPFAVRFADPGYVGYKLADDVLTIHPDVTRDTDPREVILRAAAGALWPLYARRFTEQYPLLLKMGLVHPSRPFKSVRELWTHEYVDAKLNQHDEYWEVAWWKTHIP